MALDTPTTFWAQQSARDAYGGSAESKESAAERAADFAVHDCDFAAGEGGECGGPG